MIERGHVSGPNGRLEVSTGGPADGLPLIYHHGTPMAGLLYAPTVATAAGHGVRMVAYSRPGYAGSTRHEGRSVADCARDVEAVADALGFDRFYTAGVSGGGPHALATAALLGDRVIAAATLGGITPWDAEGLDFLDGMGPENHVELGAAAAGEAELRPLLNAEGAQLAEITGETVAAAMGELLSDVDRSALTGEYSQYAAAEFRAAVRQGIDGWLDDDLAFVKPWGFELEAITVPLTIWQGEHDRFVPAAHGRWLAAHIAGAKPRLLSDQGHLSIELSLWDRVVGDLLASG